MHNISRNCSNLSACSGSLGASINGSLPVTAFVASSNNDVTSRPSQGRLGNTFAWIPNDYRPSIDPKKLLTEFLQVDLGSQHMITAVAVQGLQNNGFYVTEYRLQFSKDGLVFDGYFHEKAFQDFKGNANESSISVAQLPCPVVSRYLRLIPQRYVRGIALKVDVFGCKQIQKPAPSIKEFKIVETSQNSIHLSWTSNSSDIQIFTFGYFAGETFFKFINNFPVGVNKEVDLHEVRYDQPVTGLNSCTGYVFQLRVFNLVGCGTPQVYTIKQATLPTRPITPQMFTYVNSIPETIMLYWKKSRLGYLCADSIQRFILMYRVQIPRDLFNAGAFQQVLLPSDATSYNLTSLQGWKKYDVQISAENSMGQSDYAVLASIDVVGKPPSVPPEITKLESNEPRQIFLKWKTPDAYKSSITGYSVLFRLKSEVDWERISLHQGTATSMKITAPVAALEPWKVYQVKVSMYNREHEIESAVKDILVKGEAPGEAPQNLTATSVQPTNISLQWSAIPQKYLPNIFQGYQIFSAQGDRNFIKAHTDPVMKTSRVILNLVPDVTYRFKVAAVSNDFIGPYSKIFTASTPIGVLNAPVITSLDTETPNTIKLAWSVEGTYVTQYKVHYKLRKITSSWSTLNVAKGTNQATLKGLLAWDTYHVKVELYTATKQLASRISKVIVQGETPGGAPTNVYASNVLETAIKLEWDEVDPQYLPSTFQGYQVWLKAHSANFYKVNETQRPNHYNVRGLLPNTSYTFKVAAVANKLLGPFSQQLTIKTFAVVPPQPPIIVNVDIRQTKIKVTWNAQFNSRISISLFTLKLRDLDKQEDIEMLYQTRLDQKATYARLIPVKPYTKYALLINSCISGKCSTFSKPFYFHTLEAAASVVQNLKVVNRDDTAVGTWSRPAIVPGILRQYVVEWIDTTNGKVDLIELENDTLAVSHNHLLYFRPYIMRVHAITVMPGPALNYSFISPEGPPTEPTNVAVILLKSDMISIKWNPPQKTNGNITQYKIVYHGTKRYNSLFSDKKTKIIAADKELRTRIEGLVPGTVYKVHVFARTSRGYGIGSTTQSVITPVRAPKAPPVPVTYSDQVTDTTVTIRVDPTEQLFGPVSTYQIIVEKLGEVEGEVGVVTKRRRRRSVDNNNLHDYHISQRKKLNYYIAAELDASKMPAKFEVGDGVIYNRYLNQPLQPETEYKVHIRAKTPSQNGQLFGPLTSIRLPKTQASNDEESDLPVSKPILIIICAAAAFILIIVIIVALYIKSSRRRRSRQNQMDPFQLGLMQMQKKERFDDDTPERPTSLSSDYAIHPDHPPVSVGAFTKHVQKLHKNFNMGFKDEYKKLKIGKEFSWDVAHLPENKPKNRYANIVAYDHSRVILQKVDGQPGSDYINASYMDGYKKANSCIATQGPLPETFNDLWRMAWELRSSCIVMLTNLQEKNKLKCHKYWPDKSLEYGDIIVTMVTYKVFATHIIRTFKLEKVPNSKSGHEIHEVKQFHFTAWPEHGVPNYPTALLAFRKKVKLAERPNSGPLIVHCSAGVGRSGAYIVLDTMLDRLKVQQDVDVFNCVASLRMRRIAMVQTEDQYVFVHDAILEQIASGETEIAVGDLKTAIRRLNQMLSESKVSGFEKQWKILNHAVPLLPPSTDTALENPLKNRFSTVLPTDNNRVLLLPTADGGEDSTYINAVYVDSFRTKNAYILTQCPLPRTINDFWRMIAEHGSNTIVMLNALDEGDDYATFWPDLGVRQFGPIAVECLPSKREELTSSSKLKPIYRILPQEIIVKNFNVTDTRVPNGSSMLVKLFQYSGWNETRVPTNCKHIITLLTLIDRWRIKGESPLSIMCSDGIGRSGTVASIMYALEKVEQAGVVDVFQAVKSIRSQRTHSVKYMDQYKFIHMAVQEYLSAFENHVSV